MSKENVWLAWGALRAAAIPSLAGGGIHGSMFGSLKADLRCTRAWASFLGSGVGLAMADITSLVVAIGDAILFDGRWHLVLIDTMGHTLLMLGPIGMLLGYWVGRRIWRRVN